MLVGVDEGVDAELGAAAAEGRRARDLAAQPGALLYAYKHGSLYRSYTYPIVAHSALRCRIVYVFMPHNPNSRSIGCRHRSAAFYAQKPRDEMCI